MPYAASLTDIRAARDRIAPHVHRTPVLTCQTLDALAERSLFFKCENLQKVGAFKARGAANAVFRLSDQVAARGVVTHSSGNHAQAMALAARSRGVPACVVMPKNSLAVKIRAVEGYGAEVVLCEPNDRSRAETAARVIEERGGTLIPSYDHPDIIAGQGTAALELLDQVDGLDAILTPVGGGGLLSGSALAAKGISESIRVFGAEPSGADDAACSLESGRLVPLERADTVADGLRTGLGRLTWPIIRDHVERIFRVEDEDAVAAMRLFYERVKLVIEPSSAVAVAAALSESFKDLSGIERVGVVLSGGNADLDRLPWLEAGSG
jgi:threonine dehydratase